jgi:transcriptional regulator with XRE-family HTH domain
MIGKILSRERKAAGLSQVSLAKLANIDRSYLSQLERDLKSPTVKVLLRLCESMDVSAASVLAEVESRPRRNQKP